MIDRKEIKRDVATFAHMLKELMNDPTPDVLVTLDRDIQHFIYGRTAVLVKHNEGKPIGSVADIAAVVGAAFADVLKEFTRGRVGDAELDTIVQTARANLLSGFEARAPIPDVKTEAPAQEPATEEVA
jgi:hypothetical protein